MKPLAIYQISRLRLLAERARAYCARDKINPPLEQRGLVAPTGRIDRVRGRQEWAITDQGRASLAAIGKASQRSTSEP